MVEFKNLFMKRPIKWEIKLPKGANFFANGVNAESEALLSDDVVLKVLNMKDKEGKLIIQAEVIT